MTFSAMLAAWLKGWPWQTSSKADCWMNCSSIPPPHPRSVNTLIGTDPRGVFVESADSGTHAFILLTLSLCVFLLLCAPLCVSSSPPRLLSNHLLPCLPTDPSQIWVSRQLLAFSLLPLLTPSTSWGTSVRTSPPKPCMKHTHTRGFGLHWYWRVCSLYTSCLPFSQVHHQNGGQFRDAQRDRREPEGTFQFVFSFCPFATTNRISVRDERGCLSSVSVTSPTLSAALSPRSSSPTAGLDLKSVRKGFFAS